MVSIRKQTTIKKNNKEKQRNNIVLSFMLW